MKIVYRYLSILILVMFTVFITTLFNNGFDIEDGVVDPDLTYVSERAISITENYMIVTTKFYSEHLINDNEYSQLMTSLVLAHKAAKIAIEEQDEKMYRASKTILIEVEESINYIKSNYDEI